MFGLTIHQQARAVSSVYGKIEVVLLAFPGKQACVTQKKVMDRYRPLFESFGDRVRFVIVGCLDERWEGGGLDEAADPWGMVRVIHTPLVLDAGQEGDLRHSEFVQDPFVAMQAPYGGTLLLEPYRHYKRNNAYLAEQLADGLRIPIQPSRLYLEGGNILVGDDYALVGRNLLLRNHAELYPKLPLEQAEKAITRAFAEQLGVRYVIWVGSTAPFDWGAFHDTGPENAQPFFHLDLFLTLTGRTEQGEEGVYVGRIDLRHVHGLTDVHKPQIQAINSALEEVETALESREGGLKGPKFKVHRLDMGGRIVEGSSPRFLPYSYNNAHFERFEGITRAFFPQYSRMEALEKRIREDLPLSNVQKAEFIDANFEEYAHQKGSLHCIVKVLKRSANYF